MQTASNKEVPYERPSQILPTQLLTGLLPCQESLLMIVQCSWNSRAQSAPYRPLIFLFLLIGLSPLRAETKRLRLIAISQFPFSAPLLIL